MPRVSPALIATGLSFVLGSVGLVLLVSSSLRGDLNDQYEMFGGGAFGSAFFVLVGLVHVVIAIDLLIPRWRHIGAAGAALLMGLALIFTLALQTSPKPVGNLLNLRLVTAEIEAADLRLATAEIEADARADFERCLVNNPYVGRNICAALPASAAAAAAAEEAKAADEAAKAAYDACLDTNPVGVDVPCEAPPSDALATRLLVWIRDVIGYRPPDAIGYQVINESILNVAVAGAALLLLRNRRSPEPTLEPGDREAVEV